MSVGPATALQQASTQAKEGTGRLLEGGSQVAIWSASNSGVPIYLGCGSATKTVRNGLLSTLNQACKLPAVMYLAPSHPGVVATDGR